MKLKRIRWNEIKHGNKFSQNINRIMTFGAEVRLLTIPKENKLKGEKETIEVVYDREYVKQYLVRKIFAPIGVKNYATIEPLLCEAFEVWLEQVQAEREVTEGLDF